MISTDAPNPNSSAGTPAGSAAPLTDYFQQLAGVLNLQPDEYHNGSGAGQAQPNTMFGAPAAAQAAPAAPAAAPTYDGSGDVAAAPDVPDAQASPVAPVAPVGPQGAVPLTTGGATPVTPYT